MARLCLHRLRLPGLRLGRPIPEPRQRRSRRALPPTYRGLCVGRLGDGQAKGRPRTSCLRTLHQLRRVNAITGKPLHELRRYVRG